MLKKLTLACAVTLALALVGCGNNAPMMTAGNDLSMSMPVPDLAQPTSSSLDMAKAPGDGGGGVDGGLAGLCQLCTNNSQCASGLCAPYMGIKKCTHSCTPAMAGTDCPGINACNGMGLCKCP